MTPRATYRLQFHKDFGFDQAAAIAPYLAQLGVSHVYASPWLKARPGSTHGYDIVDHHALNPELGDEAAFHRMVEALRANGLRQILDFVPNHMGVGGADNPMWLDVLEWGPESAFAGWFDIDWQRDGVYLRDKLLIPFLGDQYGVELYRGKLILQFDETEGSFAVWAYDTHKLPVCPLHYHRILGDSHPDLSRLGDEFSNLAEWRPQAGRRAGELKAELARLAREHEGLREAIAKTLDCFNGAPEVESTWKALNELIQDQYWRPAHFRVAADDINYRRFFNINELAGLRMELPDVFEHSHALVMRLLADGTLDGLRIDHVDGLLNPKEYLERLRTAGQTARSASGLAGDAFYLVVEKILARHEGLREDWPVDGATGYEFTNLMLGLMIDPAGEAAITQTYEAFTGERSRFADIVRDSKLRIMRNEMASELNVLGRDAARVAHQHPRTADFTQNLLRRAIREVVACFPVYRTYVDDRESPNDLDRRDLDWAVKQARAHEADIDSSVFDFVHKLLSGDLVGGDRSGFSRHMVLRLAMKLQQYSGPVMAKGLEDTAFYRYNRFIALNEVGGNPDQFGVHISAFHKANALRAKRWPGSMLATSTHDTKRGEDTRARLAVLSEIPDEWAKQVQSWSRILRARRGDIQAAAPPDRNDEYVFYQLLVGTWPPDLMDGDFDVSTLTSYTQRVKTTMTKSIREAKVHSTWAAPNPAYEDAVLAFVDDALNPEPSRAFLGAFLPFARKIAALGVHNSLLQTALKLTLPGMPDIYQGTELWDLSMVDPDNRRPVDYCERMRLMSCIDGDSCPKRPVAQLLQNWRDGAVKFFVTSTILRFRRNHPELFARGEYEAISASGPKADQICAFTRRLGDSRIIVVAARFPARLQADPVWGGTKICLPKEAAGKNWLNILTGAPITVATDAPFAEDLLGELPVAILAAESLLAPVENAVPAQSCQ